MDNREYLHNESRWGYSLMNNDAEDKDSPFLLSCPVLNTDTLAKLGARLEASDLQLLRSVGNAQKFRKKFALAYTNERIEHLMFLDTGLIRAVCTGKDGTEKAFFYASGGCFVAEAAFFHQQPILYDIQFLVDSEVLFIDRIHLRHILGRPQLMNFLMTATSLGGRILAMQLEDAAFRTTEGKICRLLACLGSKEQMHYKVSFTHQEIADLTGVHRVNVTNTLNTLKKEGIISMATRSSITIINRDKLRERLSKEI